MKKIGLLLLLGCVAIAGCGEKSISVQLPDGFVLQARVADTPQKTQKGLMFVKSLPEDAGMLFLFDREDTRFFWMKNTLIDLDIIFLSAQGTINQIYENVPHTYVYTPDTQIPVVSAPAQYVLEAAAGTAAKHHLQTGDRLLFTLP